MDQTKKILANVFVDNDPAAVIRVVAPFGSTFMPPSKLVPGRRTLLKRSLQNTRGRWNSRIPVTPPT